MTDSPDKDDKPTSDPSPPPSRQSSKPTPRRAKGQKPRRLWMWLALLLLVLLIAAGVAGWFVWEELRERQAQQLSDLENRLEQQQVALEQDVNAQSEQLRQALTETTQEWNQRWQQRLSEQDRVIQALEQQLQNTSRRLQAMSSTNREDWKLAEAEYLLRLANQRLLMERDGGNALALAQQADEILQNTNDSDLFPIRRALSQGINELKAVERIDREGLYLQILALSEDIEELPLAEPVLQNEASEQTEQNGRNEQNGQNEQNEEPSDTPPDAGLWDRVTHRIAQSFNNLWAKLSGHIRISRQDEAVKGLVPPGEQFYLRQNLRLMLEQAQAALLREQPELYQRNLQRAADWVDEYYASSPDTQAVIDELRELSQVEITQTLPDLDRALSLLQAYVDRLHQAPQESADDEQSGEGDQEGDQEENLSNGQENTP